MIKIIYFNERELLVKREIKTKTPKCYTRHCSTSINKGRWTLEKRSKVV